MFYRIVILALFAAVFVAADDICVISRKSMIEVRAEKETHYEARAL